MAKEMITDGTVRNAKYNNGRNRQKIRTDGTVKNTTTDETVKNTGTRAGPQFTEFPAHKNAGPPDSIGDSGRGVARGARLSALLPPKMDSRGVSGDVGKQAKASANVAEGKSWQAMIGRRSREQAKAVAVG